MRIVPSILSIGSVFASVLPQLATAQGVDESLHYTYAGDQKVLEQFVATRTLESVEFIGCYTFDGQIRIEEDDQQTQKLLSVVWKNPEIEVFVIAMPCAPSGIPNSWYASRINQENFEDFEQIFTDEYLEDGSWKITNRETIKTWCNVMNNYGGIVFNLRNMPERY
jgi:hypothetical protein